MKRIRILAALLAVALITAACSTQTIEEEGPVAFPVEVSQVVRGDLAEVITVSAPVEPEAQVAVLPKISGNIEEVLVEVGDSVEEGQVLARIDDGDLAVQLAQAEAGLASARANLERTRAAALPQSEEQARSALEQAKANYETVADTYERMKGLYEAGAISLEQYQGTKLQFEVAREQYETARKQYEITVESQGVNLEAAEAGVLQAEAAVEIVRRQIENAIIRAPISGRVASVTAEKGALAAPGSPLFVIVDPDPAVLNPGVGEVNVNRVKVGGAVKVEVDAAGVTLEGTIVNISPAADQRTRDFQVRVEVPNPEGVLKPGMFARLTIPLEVREGVLAVPSDSVIRDGDKEFVFVVRDGVARMVEVETGLKADGRAEIRRGLSGGEEVVSKGQKSLEDGMAVRVTGRGEER